MRILVTGGAGFIGSHVAERLLALGHEVAILDDFNDYYDPRLKEANLCAVQETGPVRVFRGDIRDRDAVNSAFAGFVPDAVIHLAARAGVQPSLAAPELYESVNAGGTLVVLEAARRHGIRKFILASSSSVYGLTDQAPFREDDACLMPISPYAATKIAAEKLCFTYSHLYGIRVACLRLFTVYGPRQRPDLAIRKFIAAIDAGREVTLYGDGSIERDFTYVSDTVDGIVAALGLEREYEIINIGGAHPVTLDRTIAALESALGKKARVNYKPLPQGDVPRTYADISKAAALLGYRPKVTFEEGIRRTVEWVHVHASDRARIAIC